MLDRNGPHVTTKTPSQNGRRCKRRKIQIDHRSIFRRFLRRRMEVRGNGRRTGVKEHRTVPATQLFHIPRRSIHAFGTTIEDARTDNENVADIRTRRGLHENIQSESTAGLSDGTIRPILLQGERIDQR